MSIRQKCGSCTPADKDFVQTENTTVRWKDGHVYSGNLLYTLKPITQVVKERERKLLTELKLVEARRKLTQQVKSITPDRQAVKGKNYSA